MDKRKVAFLTLGCKVNSYETDGMEKLFREAGYDVVKFNEIADVYVVNTCSVTNMADRKSRQMLHKARKNNPDSLIVATGCYVQASTEEVSKDETIDLLVGNNRKKEIVNIVEKHIIKKYSNQYKKDNKDLQNENIDVIDINDTSGKIEYEDMHIDSTGENTRAYIKIQDGCNQFCSYCIIPYARGRIRSRKKESILAEVESLASNGYKEVVLTGIHISSYGLDFEKEKIKGFKYEYLLDVIKSIALIDGIKRIRLGSLEPRIISEDFISQLSKIDKVCPHFHLSLQSGCNDTLKRMNRKYTVEEFFEGCNILRKYYNEPALTTDVIVGFAGETEDEFETTYKYLQKIKFAQMHIFKYSKRKGTVAERMPNQVTEDIKTQRSKELLAMSSRYNEEYQKLFINTNQQVLIEEKVSIDNKEYYIGHTDRYVKVAVFSTKNIENEIICVNIMGQLTNDILKAKMI